MSNSVILLLVQNMLVLYRKIILHNTGHLKEFVIPILMWCEDWVEILYR